jgi:hypothetical protein
MFLALPTSVLAAYGLAHLLPGGEAARVRDPLQQSVTLGRPVRKRWVVALLMTLIVGAIGVEYLVIPYPLQAAQVSPFYAQLAEEPHSGAILNVPIDPYASKPYMYAQTVHQHPIVQGRVSRYPEGAFDYVEGQPWIRAMRRYPNVPPKQMDISRQLGALEEDGILYLIVHKSLIGDEHWDRWARYLALEPRFEDAEIAAFSTSPVAGKDFELSFELLPGLGIIRAVPSARCTRPGRVFEVDVAWGTGARPGQDLNVTLALVSPDGTARHRADFAIAADWPSHDWPANAVLWGEYSTELPADLPVGIYDLTLALSEPDTGLPLGTVALIDHVEVQASPCVYPVPGDAVAVNALLGDAMRLLGYRLEQQADRVALTLLWRSERRMATDYKVFVHIFDLSTGIPVAQDDSMPLHWTYPTSYWIPGEVVTDVIPISVEQVPHGVYGLAVGAYDPASGERLPVYSSLDQVQPDGRLVLVGESVRIE